MNNNYYIPTENEKFRLRMRLAEKRIEHSVATFVMVPVLWYGWIYDFIVKKNISEQPIWFIAFAGITIYLIYKFIQYNAFKMENAEITHGTIKSVYRRNKNYNVTIKLCDGTVLPSRLTHRCYYQGDEVVVILKNNKAFLFDIKDKR